MNQRINLNHRLRTARGAIDLASIMVGVIVIGLIAGVISATVFAVIPWAQDRAAAGNLDAVATAESVAKTKNGGYLSSRELIDEKLLPESKSVAVRADTNCYAGFSGSASGSVFLRTSKTAETVKIASPWPAEPPAGFPTGCVWPKGPDAALTHRIGNLASEPVPARFVGSDATLGWTNTRWFGPDGNTGTYSIETGSSPVGSGFARKTWTAAPVPSTGDTGFGHTGVAVKAGQQLTFSAYMRSSADKTALIGMYTETDGVAVSRQHGKLTNLVAGKWSRVSHTFTVPTGITTVRFVSDIGAIADSVGGPWKAGDTLDATGIMLTETATVEPYADGNSPGWSWTGTPGRSSSVGYPVTLDSIAGPPVINVTNPALGTVFPQKFNSHTAVSAVDTTFAGQRGWVASVPAADTVRWEALNVQREGPKMYAFRTQKPSSNTSKAVFRTTVTGHTGVDVVAATWAADGIMTGTVRNHPDGPGVTDGLVPTPGYQLQAGVRDVNTDNGVSPVRLVVFDRVLTVAEQTLVLNWIAAEHAVS